MTTGATVPRADRLDAQIAVRAPARLAAFNRAGVLIAADVHVAMRLGGVLGEADELVLLAAALAVRGPRVGHVCIDLTGVRRTVAVDRDAGPDVQELPWPDTAAWVDRVARSAMVAVGEDAPTDRPFRLNGSRLYLDRYWRDERRVAAQFLARCGRGPSTDSGVIESALARLFADPSDAARSAARCVASSRLAVITGGPGTGKTTAVTKIVALLCEQARAAGRPWPLIALGAPTGKAADRLQASIREQAPDLDTVGDIRAHVGGLETSTLHRLLGSHPRTRTRFVHDREHPLPHDVVVVDEASMISLSLMARLFDALRPDARLVLVGDPGQLASVEAGTVLGDVIGTAGLVTAGPLADNVVVLERVHRFGDDIARLAHAIRDGRSDDAVAALRSQSTAIGWIEPDQAPDGLAVVRERAVAAGEQTVLAARRGDARTALASLSGFRVLCAHRRGTYGVSEWTVLLERWLAERISGFRAGAPWYVGRPVMVTANDYALGLFNGDTGVVVAGEDGRPEVAFARGGSVVRVSPVRLVDTDTVQAMTIHKSQGSQFDTVVVVVPDQSSPLLTRELLYTGVTRARAQVIVVGSEGAIRAAVDRPIARASGLRERLWGPGQPDRLTGSGAR